MVFGRVSRTCRTGFFESPNFQNYASPTRFEGGRIVLRGGRSDLDTYLGLRDFVRSRFEVSGETYHQFQARRIRELGLERVPDTISPAPGDRYYDQYTARLARERREAAEQYLRSIGATDADINWRSAEQMANDVFGPGGYAEAALLAASPLAARQGYVRYRAARVGNQAVAVGPLNPGVAPRPVPSLPKYDGGKTSGVLRFGESDVPLMSGYKGPSASMPKGTPGMHGNIKSHVEAHAAAIMREKGLSEATLYINQVPCPTKHPRSPGCFDNLPKMLPEGARLRVIGPDGFDHTFIGLPDPIR